MQVECAGIIPVCQAHGKIEILLIKHLKGNYWGFPKGHQEVGETPTEAAIREFQEETGIKEFTLIPHQEILEENYSFFSDEKQVYIEKKVRYFLAETPRQELHLQTEEIIDACWVEPVQALSLLSFPEKKRLLQQALELLL